MARKHEYRKREPRNRALEVSVCTFTVPRDESGDFILPPMRGWRERRLLMIADLTAEIERVERKTRYRKGPILRILDLKRVIRGWEQELKAGIPAGDDIYGPMDKEDDHAAA